MSKNHSQRNRGAGRGHGGMMVMGQKPKDFKGTFRRLLSYLAPRRNRLILVFIAAILSTVFMILGPKIMGNTITVVFNGVFSGTGIDFGEVGKLLLFLAGLYAFSSLFTFAQQYMMASVAQRTVFDLREDVFHKLDKLPLKYYDGTSHGDTLSRVTNDIDTIGNTLQQSITQFI